MKIRGIFFIKIKEKYLELYNRSIYLPLRYELQV